MSRSNALDEKLDRGHDLLAMPAVVGFAAVTVYGSYTRRSPSPQDAQVTMVGALARPVDTPRDLDQKAEARLRLPSPHGLLTSRDARHSPHGVYWD